MTTVLPAQLDEEIRPPRSGACAPNAHTLAFPFSPGLCYGDGKSVQRPGQP